MKRQQSSSLLLASSGQFDNMDGICEKSTHRKCNNSEAQAIWSTEMRPLEGMEIDDVIYGKIHLPTDVLAIVETPQFYRLKSVRQMGFLQLDNVREYQDNRYNHCIGTYHAADRMLDALEKNTPWLSDNNNKIPLVYRRAVQIAALLHDIGHGPFSHTWERVAQNYEHETIGFACVDEIFATIDKNIFPELRANNNYGIRLIKALIQGKLKKLHTFQLELPTKFEFIFSIVSNEGSKLDVDKWDYLKRDHYYIKELCNPAMDFDDVFLKAKVSLCGQYIEYRYEDFDKIYNLFAARWHFHKNCYQLPRNLICDHIFQIAIDETTPLINGHKVHTIDAEHDMSSFLQLIDNRVLSLIEGHRFREFLNYDAKFEEVEREKVKIENKSCTYSFIIDIPSIGSFVKEDNFHFYGDEKYKSNVIDQTETIKKRVTFHCDLSTHTVYYCIQPF